MHLAVYVDDVYRRDGDLLTTAMAFPLFVAGLADELDRVTLLGRLDPTPGRTHHKLPAGIDFVALPYYETLAGRFDVARGMATTLLRFWRVLGDVDAVWLLGPHPVSVAAALLAALRGRQVVLGVREHTTQYGAHRHPDNRWAKLVFGAMQRAWRLLARVWPIVVVGPELAALYARAPRLLDLTVSMVSEADIVAPSVAADRDYDGELRILSVGRLDAEKNPLLLADVLHALVATHPRARLLVCGEGQQERQLAERLDELGLSERADLLGYVPIDGDLQAVYRSSHAFLHVSWTEGVPQVLFEAFAARLPTVATDVGGIASTAADAVLLVGPGDAPAAATALARVLAEAALREQLIDAGLRLVRVRTKETQLRRLAVWLQGLTGEQRGAP